LPDAAALHAAIAAHPGDLQARLDLAQLHVARREFEPALEQLLEIVQRDRAFGDDIGRKSMLAVFDLIADQPAVLAAWRRRLSSALNR
jgi:putative thioredoxin